MKKISVLITILLAMAGSGYTAEFAGLQTFTAEKISPRLEFTKEPVPAPAESAVVSQRDDKAPAQGICSSVKTFWQNDKVLSRAECAGGDGLQLCLTRAVWGFNNEAYYQLSGSDRNGYRVGLGVVFVNNDKEGTVAESAGKISITRTPTPAAIVDQYKYRYAAEMDTKSGSLRYVSMRKPVMSPFSSWETQTDSVLKCRAVR